MKVPWSLWHFQVICNVWPDCVRRAEGVDRYSQTQTVHGNKAQCAHAGGESVGIGPMLLLGRKQTFETNPNPLEILSLSISLPQFYSLFHCNMENNHVIVLSLKVTKKTFLRQWVLENNCSPTAPQLSLWWTVFVTEAETLLSPLLFVWMVSKEKER